MALEPYLYFPGNAAEAIAYYEKTLGALTIAKMLYRDAPDDAWKDHLTADYADKVMHSLLHIDGAALMLADYGSADQHKTFSGFALTLSSHMTDDTEKYYNALVADGRTILPLSETFFAKMFGMVTDKFGVAWTLITPTEMSAD